ncbi:MAG: adenosylmethionine decarboxylase [Betaproteobacteria bacterium]
MENATREHLVLHEVAGNARQLVKPSMIGSQLVLDLYECDVECLDDLEWVKATMIAAARAARATIVQTVFHKFAPWGISGVVVIAESHLAIHTWPEKRYAAIDLFTCGSTVDMSAATALLTREFRSARPVQRYFTRGDEIDAVDVDVRKRSKSA